MIYEVTVRQGSNVIKMYAGQTLDYAQDFLAQLINGLKECDDPWSVTLEEQDDR